MSKIIIQNVGAINKLEIDLNKINILMGPQSSGKSTIAKIISYCQWVEKRFILDGEYRYKFSEQFINYHRVDENYFSKESFIQYESEFIFISYKGIKNKQTINRKNSAANYLKSKNIYIPAERNFVSVIPNLRKYKESNDNIMNFLYDWYDAKKKYTKNNSLSILNLGIDYHHIEENDADILTILEKNKEISLKNASSGLQSVIPLIMLINYLSTDFYNEEHFTSIEESDEIRNILMRNIRDDIEGYIKNDDSIKKLNEDDKFAISATKRAIKILDLRIRYHYSSFIIEEPEQNLFPETQRDFIYYLLAKINNAKKNHSVIITTHSPYILYALNNCMMGYNVKEEIPEDVKQEMLSSKSWINPDLVSVWEIEQGELKSIKDKKTGTVSKHYFNRIMNDVMNEYYEMLNYFNL